MSQRVSFKHVDGTIILVVEQLVWGEWVVELSRDVTEQVIPVVDGMLDFNLGLSSDGEYKHKGTRINYVGDDKN